MISLSNGAVSGEAISDSFSGYFRNRIEVFDETPGTKQLTIPSGWNRIRVAVVGAGGAGAEFSSGNTYTNGGGGGGYSEITLDVVPGQVYSYTVGAGGTTGTAGGTSSFGGLISATGGGRGTPVSTTTYGAGGVGIGGSVNTTGGAGGKSSNLGGSGGGGSSANRYSNGGDGWAAVYGGNGNGGSWPNYPRPLLYDDGFGLGITPYTPPISFVGAVIRSAANTATDTGSSNALNPIASVGMGQFNTTVRPNIGGGKCGSGGGTTPSFASAGIGGGGGGAPSGYNIGGNGLVLVEVLG